MSRDWVYGLHDIVEYGTKIASYTHGLTREEFRANEMVLDAVLRNLDLIGAAAKTLPAAVTSAQPEAAWARAIAFRAVLAHPQFGLDANVVWDLAQTRIPELVVAARAALLRFSPAR